VYGFSSTQLLVVWSASSDNDRVASYRIYRNGNNVGTTQIPIFTDTNLSPATTYQYTVVAIDVAGNTSPASAPATGTTLPVADRIAPSIPGGVSAVAPASNRVSVAWGASSDNVKVAGYKIFRNGSLIAITVAPPFLDALVLSNTSYTYKVAAFDTSGNASALSAGAVVTTPR
jgi:chitodextrinase